VADDGLKRRLAAILCADAAGYSRLMAADEAATIAALEAARAVFRRQIEAHRGRVVDMAGDSVLGVFDTAAGALDAALGAQSRLPAAGAGAPEALRFRIGVHLGDVSEKPDGTIYGDGVNVAARLQALADPGGIVVSEAIRGAVRGRLAAALVDRGDQNVKNLPAPVRAFALALPDAAPATLRAALAPLDDATPSIAVLPFVNLSDDPANEHFADGLAEELVNVLAKIPGLRVASRTSAFCFRGKAVDVPTVAERLHVSSVLEGSVRRSAQRVRITAQLIRAATDSHLWSQSYDRDLDDVFAVQDDIARRVVQELRAALCGEMPDAGAAARVEAQLADATRGRTANAQAHALYLQGRFLIDRLTRDDTTTGIGYCRQAIQLDPRYALAWAGLAGAHSNQAGYGWEPLAPTFELARAAALHALEIEPALAEAHAELGWVRMTYDWDWRGAEASYRRALELGAGTPSIVVAASLLADNLGRQDDAVALARRAVELDPLSFIAQGNLGLRCFNAGALAEAAAAVEAALRLHPRGTLLHWLLGTIRLAEGRTDAAMREFVLEEMDRLRQQGLVLALQAQGRWAEADAALDELIAVGADDSAFQIAEALACRGDADRAFEWLERARAQRDAGVSQLQAGPLLRHLHGDARWRPFLAAMGFVGAPAPPGAG
jgi:TolB-like protein/Tfp pilus assembly protein PilF